MKILYTIILALLSSTSFGQTGQWVETTPSGCKAFSASNGIINIEWDGACKNSLTHGIGRVRIYLNKNLDTTGVVNYSEGKLNGRGTVRNALGHKYDGEFKDGLPNGQGRLTKKYGVEYFGEFKNGIPNGLGAEIDLIGSIFEGRFVDGKPNGEGTYTFKSGTNWVGEFKDGHLNGRGILYNEKDQIYSEGIFKDDELERPLKIDPNSFIRTTRSNFPRVSSELLPQEMPFAQTGKSKCYLFTMPTAPSVKSCDPLVILSSLSDQDVAGLWRFKSPTEIEVTVLQPQASTPVKTKISGYQINGNLMTKELLPNCFITIEVEEGSQYRKEFFKSASSSCPAYLVNSWKSGIEELKSGRDKGYLIVYE